MNEMKANNMMVLTKTNNGLILRNIYHSRLIVICCLLLAMAALCGMSEASVSSNIMNTLPHTLGTLQGYVI